MNPPGIRSSNHGPERDFLSGSNRPHNAPDAAVALESTERTMKSLPAEQARHHFRTSPAWWSVALLLLAALTALAPGPLAPAPLAAQVRSTQADSLRAEIAELRAELDRLRSIIEAAEDARVAAEAAARAERAAGELDRLRAAAAAAAMEGQTDTARAGEQEFVGRQRSLQSLNPEISVSADVFGAIREGAKGRGNFVPREFEFAFQSALDPYSRAKIFAGIETPGAEIEAFEEHGEGAEDPDAPGEEAGHGGGIHVEEGYVEWVNLPGGFQVKLGQFYQQFGQLNRWHSHALYFQSRSLPHLAFIGEEPLGQAGVSTHWLIPASLGGTYEVTFELTRSSNAALFGESDRLSYLGHVNSFWQLTESLDLDLGVSGIFGTHEHEQESFRQRMYGVEGTVTWTPLGRSRYRGLVMRGGLMVRDPGATDAGDAQEGAKGLWTMAETKLGEQWRLGGRFDWTENPEEPTETAWLAGPTLTWWQSEWVRLRAEYAHVRRLAEGSGLFTFQVTMAMGPHKHETY